MARPDLAAQLVDVNDATLSIGNDRVVLWRCPNHAEPFPQKVVNRVRGYGCCYYTGKRVLTGFNDLATLHPDLAAQLYDPSEATSVTVGSDRLLLWRCPNHDEPYKLRVAHKTRGVGCGYCSGMRVLARFNDMATTHPDLAGC